MLLEAGLPLILQWSLRTSSNGRSPQPKHLVRTRRMRLVYSNASHFIIMYCHRPDRPVFYPRRNALVDALLDIACLGGDTNCLCAVWIAALTIAIQRQAHTGNERPESFGVIAKAPF